MREQDEGSVAGKIRPGRLKVHGAPDIPINIKSVVDCYPKNI